MLYLIDLITHLGMQTRIPTLTLPAAKETVPYSPEHPPERVGPIPFLSMTYLPLSTKHL